MPRPARPPEASCSTTSRRRTRWPTWRASGSPSGAKRSTTTASPTGPISGRSTPRCTRPRAPHGPRRQRRPEPGLVRRQPRPGHRLRPQHRHLLRLGRQVRRRLRTSAPTAPRSSARTTGSCRTFAPRRRPAGSIGPAEWNDAFVGAGVLQSTAGRRLPTRSRPRSTTGDFSGIKGLYDAAAGQGPGADNGYAVYLAVQCTDAHWPQSWSRWQRDNWRDPREGTLHHLEQRLVQRPVPHLVRPRAARR